MSESIELDSGREVTLFYGGKERGLCVQIDYVQLTLPELEELATRVRNKTTRREVQRPEEWHEAIEELAVSFEQLRSASEQELSLRVKVLYADAHWLMSLIQRKAP